MASTRQIIEKHQCISREISRDRLLNDHLIEQMHKKKFIAKRSMFHPRNDESRDIYKQILWTNKSWLTTHDIFPSDFKSKMEDELFKKLEASGYETTIDDTDVYYGRNQGIILDEESYVLSNNTELTVNDKEIIKKYADDHLALLENVELAASFANSSLSQISRSICFLCDLLIK